MNNGIIYASGSGGTGTLQFSLNGSPLQPGGTFNNLSAGSYSVLVQDANGCQTNALATIGNNSSVVLTIDSTHDVTCAGQRNGAIFASAANGTAPYRYTINGLTYQTNNGTFTGLSGNAYTVLVIDAAGCSDNQVATIVEPNPLTATIDSVHSINCGGDSSGIVYLTVSGGTAGNGYTYLWSTGATTQNLTNIPAGNYYVTVTDANGCSTTASTVVTQPQPLFVSLARPATINCYGDSTGVLDINVFGGVAPYTYSWSNGDTNQDAAGLAAGSYTVTVTDAHGCQNVNTYTVTQPAAALAATGVVTDATCVNPTGGAIDITVTGGVGPYTYNWTNGSSTEDLTGLSAGTYTVQVTDNNACTVSATFTVTGGGAIAITLDSTHNLSCYGTNDGAVYISVTGGNGVYTYNWSNGTSNQDLTGVAGGSYSVTVADGSGCQSTFSAVVTSPSALVVSVSVTDVSCNGGADGSATTTVTGGTQPYTYLWSDGSILPSRFSLSAGILSVQVTDASGCTAAAAVLINQPAPIVVQAAVTDVNCNGQNNGSIALTVNGGTPSYAYNWSNGATTQVITGLAAGSYGVTITDARNCQTTGTFTVGQPTALTVSLAHTNVNCNGNSTGSVTSTTAGGTGTYTYLWSNGQTSANLTAVAAGTYTVVVSDAHGCTASASATVTQTLPITVNANITQIACSGGATGSISATATGGTGPYSFSWSTNQVNNGVSNSTITGLVAGTYSVTVTDVNGCSVVKSFTITQPTAIALSASVTDLTCNGSSNGAVDLTVTGGTAPYTYLWTGGATTQDLTNIPAGTYTVNLTDNAGCTSSLTVVVHQPAALQIQGTVTDVSCNGSADGNIYLTINGGTAPYVYHWGNNASTQDLINISGGSYAVTVTDAHSCSTTQSFTVAEPQALSATLATTNVSCFGAATGTITTTVAGGSGAYTYLWSNGATTQNLTALTAGTYTVQVTDAHGCKVISSATITQNPNLLVSGTSTNVSCNGLADGTITLTVSGGVPTYTYTWTGGLTGPSPTGVAAGNYSVTVADNAGCSKNLSFTITEPAGFVVTDTITSVKCHGSSNGYIGVTVTGGVTPYTYHWNDGGAVPNRLNLAAGTYDLTITDAHGCSTTRSYTVTQPDSLATLVTGNDATCAGFSDGNALLTVTGGTQPYSYFWSNFRFTQNLNNITVGTYTVLVTDANGCTKVDSITIGQPMPLTLILDPVVAGCGNDSMGQVISSVAGGTQPYHYFWSNTDTTINITGLHAGTYSLTVTDGHGCSVAATAVVSSNPLPVASFTFNVACAGAPTEFINTSAVSAGTLSYSWSFGDGDTSTTTNPIHTFATAGSYQVSLAILTDKGCKDTITEQVAVNALPVAAITASGDTSNRICAADSVTLSVPDSLSTIYSWSTSATTSSIVVTQSGDYEVTVTNLSGCAVTDSVHVSVYRSSDITITPDTTISLGYSAQLVATGGIAYVWAPSTGLSDSTIANPIASPLATTTYIVTVTPDSGCFATRQVTVTVVEDFLVQAPNVFTPNGDGVHDLWVINNILNYPVCEVTVYNRWGTEVFHAAPYYNNWDGTQGGSPVADGTYYYVIKCNSKVYSGSITIVR